MAVDLQQLVRGVLVWHVREQALDDVRWERVVRGFGEHYDVSVPSQSLFRFERGEGYLKSGRFDAFSMVDAGLVERIREEREDLASGNVVMLAPRFGWLRYELVIRTTLIVWAAILLCGWIALGGSPLYWLFGLLLIWSFIAVSVQWSMKRKLRNWLARESWN